MLIHVRSHSTSDICSICCCFDFVHLKTALHEALALHGTSKHNGKLRRATISADRGILMAERRTIRSRVKLESYSAPGRSSSILAAYLGLSGFASSHHVEGCLYARDICNYIVQADCAVAPCDTAQKILLYSKVTCTLHSHAAVKSNVTSTCVPWQASKIIYYVSKKARAQHQHHLIQHTLTQNYLIHLSDLSLPKLSNASRTATALRHHKTLVLELSQ